MELLEMTNEDYKLAREELGFNIQQWVETLGISESSHKSFNSGRRDIPLYIEKHIETLRKLHTKR